jgi:hypothetical protein
MPVRRTTAFLVLLIAAWLNGPHVTAAAEDTLAHAKELYASAAYDEALAELDRLLTAAGAGDATSIAEYRVFCLLALDRRDEAQKNIEGILLENPRYLPPGDQASPRIQSVFRDVRRQALPRIVMDRYRAAKAAFERKDSHAGALFEDLLTLMDDPDLTGTPALSDLRTVAQAFRDLTNAMAVASPQESVAKPASARAATPEPGATVASPPTQASPQALSRQADPSPSEPTDLIYTSADDDVAPPVPQSQRVPRWVPSRAEAEKDYKGTLELIIDEKGSVVSATMRASVHPMYNAALVRAAKDWKFLPARRQGTPVRYLKIIEIHLKPTTS